MRDYTNLYFDILFYTKELDSLDSEMKNPLLSDSARARLDTKKLKIKAKLDSLTEKVPEISEN